MFKKVCKRLTLTDYTGGIGDCNIEQALALSRAWIRGLSDAAGMS